MSRSRWVLEPEHFQVLVEHARDEKSLYAASKVLGVVPNTIRAACRDAGLGAWLEKHFPNRQGQGGGGARGEMKSRVDPHVRWLTPEQIKAPLQVPDTPQVKWLTRAWSNAA